MLFAVRSLPATSTLQIPARQGLARRNDHARTLKLKYPPSHLPSSSNSPITQQQLQEALLPIQKALDVLLKPQARAFATRIFQRMRVQQSGRSVAHPYRHYPLGLANPELQSQAALFLRDGDVAHRVGQLCTNAGTPLDPSSFLMELMLLVEARPETTHDLSNQGLETSFKDLEAAGYEVRLADQPVLVETIKNWRTLVV